MATIARRRLRLESLEDRWLPAITFNTPNNGTPTTGVLVISGDDAVDNLSITDTGRNDTNTTYHILANGLPFRFNGVVSLFVDLGGGDDLVDYTILQEVELRFFADR